MKISIDYPSEEEIMEQKKKVMSVALRKKDLSKPTISVVFFNFRLCFFIGLLVYVFLLGVCFCIRGIGNEGEIVLTLYPVTYFAFYFLSILSEEQNEVIELKMSMKYSFMYLVSIRMFYMNIISVFMNLAMIGILHSQLYHVWSLAAAGTTADILLAVGSLSVFEKTGSSVVSGLVPAVWIVINMLFMTFGNHLYYHLLIEVIPLLVHVLIVIISFIILFRYIRKVEWEHAYNF